MEKLLTKSYTDMECKEQIKALKAHKIKINISMCDGICAYEKPDEGIFLVKWVVEDSPRSCYDPGEITIEICGEKYTRSYADSWENVPDDLLEAFEKSDLSDILMADTSEWGDGLYMAVYGLDDDTDIYNLDWEECPYDLDVCHVASLVPKYDFIKV